jgi:hypothetical protein
MNSQKRQFAVCVDNTDYYHRSQFILVEFPAEVEKALMTA